MLFRSCAGAATACTWRKYSEILTSDENSGTFIKNQLKKAGSYDTLILFDIGGGEVGVLRIILTIIFIIDCIALSVIVLMQEGKSAGLGTIGGLSETYWGKNKGRSMEGALVKITKALAIGFVVLAIVLNLNF